MPPSEKPVAKPLVLLAHPFFPAIVRETLAPRVRVRIARSRGDWERWLPHAEGIVTRATDSVDDALLARAPRLRAVSNFAVGTDNIDLAACARRGVGVTNTPGVLSEATAELALALLLAAARRIPEGEAFCRAGGFPGWAPDLLLGLELRGRHAVLVGRGRIGRATARLFRGIGLTVEWITRTDDDASIARKLRGAQVLSLHVPLTPATRHWLDARRLALLPRDAIVVNVARGPVIDEAALTRALAARRIFAAGLDVFEREPYIAPALRRLPNVVLLPHIGSATGKAREAMARLAFRGVLDLLDGKRPANRVKLPGT